MATLLIYPILTTVKILISLFSGVLFTQSGVDKVVDFSGNKSYIQSVFEKTFLRSVAPVLFIVITVLEVLAGGLCLIGGIILLFNGSDEIAYYGLLLSAVSILCLFTGQRIAKDYAGAAALVGYFLVMILGLLIFWLDQ